MEVWEQIRTLTCWGAPPTTKDTSHQEKLWQRAFVVSNSNLKTLPQTQPVPPGSLTTFKDFNFQRTRRDAGWPVRGWVVPSPHTTGRDPEMKPERGCCFLSSRVKTPHSHPILNNGCGKSWEIKDVWYWFQKYFCFGQNTSLITFLVAVIFHKAV